MARAKMQILTIPFYENDGEIKYCVFKRTDMKIWQFVAGGGEGNETPLEAAKRETWEETKIKAGAEFYQLECTSYVPTNCFSDESRRIWGLDCLVIPEYKFAVRVKNMDVAISHEHDEYRWVDYNTARDLLYYQSNKTALWELDNKIKMHLL